MFDADEDGLYPPVPGRGSEERLTLARRCMFWRFSVNVVQVIRWVITRLYTCMKNQKTTTVTR